jgi:hypothetical protein
VRLPLDHAMRARIGWAITAVTTVLAVVQLLMDVPGRVTVDQYVVPIWWGAAIGVVALTIWTELKEVTSLPAPRPTPSSARLRHSAPVSAATQRPHYVTSGSTTPDPCFSRRGPHSR